MAKAKKLSVSSDGLRKWFSRNKGKVWVNYKTGGKYERKSKMNGVCTLLLDTRWLNAKSFEVKQPHVKRPPLKEVI